MIQSAAKADVEETPDPSLAGKFEVVLPATWICRLYKLLPHSFLVPAWLGRVGFERTRWIKHPAWGEMHPSNKKLLGWRPSLLEATSSKDFYSFVVSVLRVTSVCL